MNKEEIRVALYRIIDALWLLENIEKLPDCNNCTVRNECPYCPKAGQMVRVNCFAWVGEEVTND